MELRKVANRDEAVRFLNQVAASGLERAVWARSNGVDPRSLNLWRVNIEREQRDATHRPLRIVELVSATPPADVGVRVRCGTFVIEVAPGFDEGTLQRVLATVSRC